MKRIILILNVLAFSLFACKNNSSEELVELNKDSTIVTEGYEVFGESFEVNEVLTHDDMRNLYEGMEIGDSIEVSFNAKVNSVCQKKGCWMKLDLGEEGMESFVKFKDYDFFVPMDAENSDAIIKGMAYKSQTSVEELRHYAEDAGKSKEEIESITEPRIEYTFMADGVYLKKIENES